MCRESDLTDPELPGPFGGHPPGHTASSDRDAAHLCRLHMCACGGPSAQHGALCSPFPGAARPCSRLEGSKWNHFLYLLM